MLRLDASAQEVFNNLTFRIDTPDGEMFVVIMENEIGKPCAIDVKVGKSGASLAAWAYSFGRVLTMAIEHGATIHEVMTELSSQSSDKSRRTVQGIEVRSGPEAVYLALVEYQRDKFLLLRKSFGIQSDEDADFRGRGSKIGRR